MKYESHTMIVVGMLVVAAAITTSSRTSGADADFVRQGSPVEVQTTGKTWEQRDAQLCCSGMGNILYAGKRMGPGDFKVTVQLALEGLTQSAASVLINDSHFGFEGKGGTMFTHGAIFGTRDLGKPIVKDGQPFLLTISRAGDELEIRIGDESVLRAPLNAQTVARIGLRPWRSTMLVSNFAATGNFAEPPLELPHVDVFTSGQGGYHSYRIPAIVATRDGTLLAFCEGRRNSRSDTGNIDMLVKRSSDQGKSWSKPIVIWDDGDNVCGNPCPVVDQQTGAIWLLMTWNLGSDHEKEIMAGTSKDVRHVYVTSSSDDGLTWSKPIKISDQVRQPYWRWYATGPGNAIQLTRGAAPGPPGDPSQSLDHRDSTQHPYHSHVFWSDDHGQTWKLGGIAGDRTNEAAVVELADGSVMLSMRSYHGQHNRAFAVSHDGGASFGEVHLDDALQTPVCQGNILRYSWPSGTERSRILFSSPAAQGRTHLTIRLSYDEGRTWPINKLVNEGGSAYSNLIALPNKRIGVLYEKDEYRTISLVTFTLDWLEGSTPAGSAGE